MIKKGLRSRHSFRCSEKNLPVLKSCYLAQKRYGTKLAKKHKYRKEYILNLQQITVFCCHVWTTNLSFPYHRHYISVLSVTCSDINPSLVYVLAISEQVNKGFRSYFPLAFWTKCKCSRHVFFFLRSGWRHRRVCPCWRSKRTIFGQVALVCVSSGSEAKTKTRPTHELLNSTSVQ